MSKVPKPVPVTSQSQTTGPNALTLQLAGMDANSPTYSPFQALSRQAANEAQIIEGMTSSPTWSSIYQAYGVPEGTDLTPYIQATRTGTMLPTSQGTAPIPQSPSASDIPAYTAPASTTGAAKGGLMSLSKKRGFASGGASDTLPADFDWQSYLAANPDLGAAGITTEQGAIDHYLQFGYKEDRPGIVGTGSAPGVTTAPTSSANTAPSSAVPSLAQAMTVQTPFYDPTQAQGQYAGVTNPLYQQAVNQLNAISQAPSTIGQGAGIMSNAASALTGAANYTPQQVAAQQAASQGYSASSMGAPSDISAQSYNAASMQGGPNVSGATIAGPQDWTSAGTAQQYMNPYIQNVLNNQLQIQNQQNAIANNALKGQAAQANAYGGAREQLALGQQQFNQNLNNQNLVQNALANAYTSGLGQFNTAQQQQLTAQQANQSSLNQANLANQLYGAGGYQTQAANQAAQNQAMQNFVNNQLAAAQTSYGGQLTAAQQNQVAQNTAASFAAQAANAAALQNAQLGTQAQIQNQQAGLTANQQNLSALQNAGSLGQGLGSLGVSTWGQQQNIPQLYASAGQTAQNLAQQAATGAQQTAQNWWGGMNTAYQPVTSMLGSFGGTTTNAATSTVPGLSASTLI